MGKLRELLTPASDAELLDALISLEQSTGKAKSEGEDAEDVKLDRYVAKLRDYPADVALHTLATWDDKNIFFPRWAELKAALDRAFAFRRQILPALQSCKPFAEEIDERTPEEMEAEKQEVRRKYVEFCRRMGTRPRADLLPDDYDGEAEPFRTPPATHSGNASGIIAQRVEALRTIEEGRERETP